MSNQIDPIVTEANREIITRIEHQIEGMKLNCYQPHTLPWSALDLAFEAVQIARFAIDTQEPLCRAHLPSLDGATHQLIKLLFPLQTEEPQIEEPRTDLPLPTTIPNWLEAT